MLYYNFYGYEGFKACFGLEKGDNGTVVRKNRILLGHLKNPALLKYCREHNDYALLRICKQPWTLPNHDRMKYGSCPPYMN